ncbi:matrix metalloproteinase-23-like isoform X3 [Podarcis muralis]
MQSPGLPSALRPPVCPKMSKWGWAAAVAAGAAVVFVLLPAAPWILQDVEAEGDEAAQSVVASATWQPNKGLTRRRRYAINPLGYKWDHVNLTYKIVQFPSTLNKVDTERAIASAFRMWSDVSPLSFRRLAPTQLADITIGFYTFNHTDCWFSPLHPCFDGLNGELAHAFLPPRGEIHFDNHEFWILGRSRFSWKQGIWLNDLVQVAAHEIGHALGLWHSRDARALMHPNATYSRTWRIGQDDVWAIQRLYGCVDEKRQCQLWAKKGFCAHRRRAFMKKHCPRICNACFEHPAATTASSLPVRPSHVHTRYISKGKVITFRCGLNSSRLHLQARPIRLRIHFHLELDWVAPADQSDCCILDLIVLGPIRLLHSGSYCSRTNQTAAFWILFNSVHNRCGFGEDVNCGAELVSSL